jgi:DNA-binding transcriptional ArsR family regulator
MAEGRTLDTRAMKALAHPLRAQLFNELTAHGPSTATALGVRVGESSGSTSYHLRQLARHGLVEELTDRGNGRDRWWRRVPGPITTRVTADDSPSDIAANRMMTSSFNAFAEQLIREAIAREQSAVPIPWSDATDLSAANLRLTATEAIELSDRLHEVLDAFRPLHDLDSEEPDTERVFVRLAILPILDDETEHSA